MDHNKLYQLLIDDKFFDVVIELIDDEGCLSINAHKIVLCASCEYFEKLFTLFREKNQSKITIKVPNRYVVRDIIIGFYGKNIQSCINDWKYQLDLVVCRDFLGLKIDGDMIKNIIVPLEGFELLIKVVEIIGFFDETIDIIIQNIPKDYDRSRLSDDLLEKITTRIEFLNKNLDKSRSILQIIVNTSKSQYIRLESIHGQKYIDDFHEFMVKYDVWNSKDRVILVEKSADFNPPNKFFDISFMTNFFTTYLKAKK
ncbi:putative BTB/POZ domain-containing protein [Acanthamoeba polyphaga mimivirus]|uniref:BTB/POZ domain-containing protein n=1 Tax=Acanthamoeba polyphaga mimivirus Kroon TaxID=3069720 RepID=A0A0G2YBZ7_9VIRU|nr:putative BTB/POZ domain-containing protein [Acanthamoeba polyphaga mimivirus]AKI80561.1 putative BTB/POZ domain-containing protein [Acanthamoeba polyphaga mimivirus Kroon]